MKLYLIYKKTQDVPILYAITNKKYIKDNFVNERKKDMFVVKSKEMPKDEITDFLNTNNRYVLGIRGFETSCEVLGKVSRTHVYLTTTVSEEMDSFIRSDIAILEMAKKTDSYSKYFNNKLINALNKLKYFEIYKFKEETYESYSDKYFENISAFDNYHNGKYCIDSFGVFMFLYGNTIDSKFILKDGEKTKDE